MKNKEMLRKIYYISPSQLQNVLLQVMEHI